MSDEQNFEVPPQVTAQVAEQLNASLRPLQEKIAALSHLVHSNLATPASQTPEQDMPEHPTPVPSVVIGAAPDEAPQANIPAEAPPERRPSGHPARKPLANPAKFSGNTKDYDLWRVQMKDKLELD